MDFKKLAGFIAFLGMVTLVYGGYQWGTNRPETAKTTQAENGSFMAAWAASAANTEAQWRVHDANMLHAAKRDTAVKIMIAGGVMLFIGLAVSASAKKKD